MKFRLKACALILIMIIILILPPAMASESFSEHAHADNSVKVSPLENPWVRWAGDRDRNKLDDLLDTKLTLGGAEPVNIFINFYSTPTGRDISTLTALGINISYIAKYIPTVCAREVPLDKVLRLQALERIAMIELQPMLAPMLDVSAPAVKARGSVEYSPETAWELGYTGRNAVIAVLDTGVDDRHESLENKYIAGYDCSLRVPRETNPDDEDGHGTHVAGIAMGTGGAEGQYRGIAPNAKLVDVKVLNDWGVSPGDQIVMGIEWCMDNKDRYDIDILSISIGEIFRGDDDGQGTQGQLVNSAVDAGLVVIVAAGNDGERGFSSLAAADNAITVGSINEKETVDRDDDEISSFSNRGPRADDGDEDVLDEYKPDVVAPGEDIMSALYSTTQFGIITGYQQLTGTSMACPHVAGLAALMLEGNPELTPKQIKQILHDTSEARGNPYHSLNDPKYSKDYGWGIIDAYEAVRKAVGEDYQQVTVGSHNMFDDVYNIVTISGTASVTKGSIQAIEFKIDQDDWWPAQGTDSWEFDWDTTAVQNGLHTVYIRSFDGIEYANPYELPLQVVNIGCEINAPSNGTVLKRTVQIQGTSFGAGVIDVFVKIGDGLWVEAEPAEDGGNLSTWKYEWDSRSVGNGEYSLSVKAYNGDWYSMPTSIAIMVKNSSSDGGFLPGFDWILILIALGCLIIINYKNKK
ncbi:S8 family serine peptidase [[Eubacterium] cellulosolvens]